MGGFHRVAAFGRMETIRTFGAPGTALAAVLFLAGHGIGRWQDGGNDGLFTVAFLLAWVLAFRPALSVDREISFDRLLLLNFVSPWEYAAGKTIAMVAWMAGLAAFAWAGGAVLSVGDVRFASWHAAMVLLVTLAALPVVVAIELALKVRLPAAVAFILALVGLVVAIGVGADPVSLLSRLGLMVTPYSYTSLQPLLLRATVGLAVAPVIIAMAARGRGYSRVF